MAYTPRAAKNAKIRIGNGVVFAAKSWVVTPESDEIDVTSFEDGGVYKCIGGITKYTIQCDFVLSGAANENPYDIVNNGIRPGLNYTGGIKFYLNDTTGPFWNFPDIFIRSVSCSANVREALTGTINAVGQGSFSYPTGTF